MKSMIAYNLRLFDWVFYKNKPYYITSISMSTCTLATTNKADVIGNETVSCMELSPIPITIKFLEKNGYSPTENDKEAYQSSEDGLILKMTYTYFEVYLPTLSDESNIPIIDIAYIHELQHLLCDLRMDENLQI